MYRKKREKTVVNVAEVKPENFLSDIIVTSF